jgi:hypothetical protein
LLLSFYPSPVFSYCTNLVLNSGDHRVLVASAYNSSYSESRDQEDHGSKPSLANNSQDFILKITNTIQG